MCSMEEFIEQARKLSIGAGGNKHALKEAEIFIQSARRDRPDETVATCCHMLLSSGRAVSSSVVKPEYIVAAQSICWICKHKKLSTEQFGSLLTLMRLLSDGCRTSHPVATQIANAISAAIVMAYAPTENWLSNALQPMLELAHLTAQKSWILHVLSIVSSVPEIAASKDVVNILCDNNCNTLVNAALSPHTQHIVNTLYIQQSVLLESAVVDQVLTMASNSGNGDAETLIACVRCCTLWLEFAATALERTPTECDSAVLAAWEALCGTAMQSITMWTRSAVLSAAMAVLSNPTHDRASNDDVLDACVEVLVALCTAVTPDAPHSHSTLQANQPRKKHPPAISGARGKPGLRSEAQQTRAELEVCLNRELKQIASKITYQLLPALSAAIEVQAQSITSLYTALIKQDRVNNIGKGVSECLCVMRGNCECVLALSGLSFAHIFHVATDETPAIVATSVQHGQLWGQYLTVFARSTRTLTDTMKLLCTRDVVRDGWEASECSDPHRQLQLLVLPLVTTLAEHTTVCTDNACIGSNTSNNGVSFCGTSIGSNSCSEILYTLRTQLVDVVHSLVEGTVVAAVTSAAYAEVYNALCSVHPHSTVGGTSKETHSLSALYTPILSLQEREDLDDFRNNVRDSLRSLVAVMPNLCTWLLRHTHDAVQTYTHNVRTLCEQADPFSCSDNVGDPGVSSHVLVREAAGLGAGWTVAEALLHAVSAVTKPILIYIKAAGLSKNELYASLQKLMHFLTTEDVISACRPLSRICAVLYGEFAPIMLQHGAVQVCSAMVSRLLLTLQHPEAPFAVQSNGFSAPIVPVCLAGLLLPSRMHMFIAAASTVSDSNSSKLIDLLCLQGCHLPFRVKQDHVGAVSLLKVVSAVHSSSSVSVAINLSADDAAASLLEQLPSALQCLQAVYTQSQGDLSHAVLLFQQHQHMHQQMHQQGASGTDRVHATLLLRYCYFCLSFLQAIPSKDRALSPKSFHLVFHSTLHCLLDIGSGRGANMCAILVPVAVAAMNGIDRQGTQQAHSTHDTAQVTQTMCASYGTSDPAVVQAVSELSTILCTQCSLAQLLFTASAVLSAVYTKYKRNPHVPELTSLVCVIDSCVPLLKSLSTSAECKAYTAIELEAVCALFLSCRIDYVLTGAFVPENLLRRGEIAGTRICIAGYGGGAEVVLPAASSLVKCLGSWYALVDVSAAFQNIVREVSELGVQVMHIEQQNAGNRNMLDAVLLEEINMRTEREDAGAAGRLSKPGELQSLGVLLQLWMSCLAATELLPQVSATVGSKAASRGAVQPSRKLLLSALSEGTLQCIVTAVCDLFAPLGTSWERGGGSATPMAVESWEGALSVIALSLGPLHSPGAEGTPITLDADGCIPGSAVTKTLTCKDAAAGVPTLVEWYVRSGTAQRITCSLLFALLQSSSDLAAAGSTNMQSFPSDLRDQCMNVFTKYILCFGAAHCTALLSAALALPECPCNGIVSSAEGMEGWVKRLLLYAAAGDWKKFKSTCKTLCRG